MNTRERPIFYKSSGQTSPGAIDWGPVSRDSRAVPRARAGVCLGSPLDAGRRTRESEKSGQPEPRPELPAERVVVLRCAVSVGWKKEVTCM